MNREGSRTLVSGGRVQVPVFGILEADTCDCISVKGSNTL